MNGHFVISLDFELHWGVFDKKSVNDYKENLTNVPIVIDRLLKLCEQYNVKLTFSTVGFLFAQNKKELLKYAPKNKPTYNNKIYNPYSLINSIGDQEKDDPYHYAPSLIKKIRDTNAHEISSHTYCHFYSHKPGQTVEQFEDDIKSAIEIAKSMNVKIESLVFPRNMIDAEKTIDHPYLYVLKKHGITSFRGKEEAHIYTIHTTKFYHNWFIFKILRMLDAYFNVTGYNTYKVESLYNSNLPLNLPSSRLLRPYSQKLNFLEPLKMRRIKKAMKYAAKHNEMFHLWWHPHNFGTHIDENFKNLESIFKAYTSLNKTHNFTSETMSGLTHKVTSLNNNNS
ncbi:polysaccharide deacetylase family protein [Ichthyenterobacterium magnum]|uniref:Polysaccharide deacetylase n=1 Tax=Ichthyenterobacterium magnum TaxID=1230530 RepID=A0A420DMB5_9FLAO|nr:polysaccharide deacetylase family protein [Ichthyenterobacterium magnum]RKE95299.1 polysaccharide deacetylase [Ichthyenterobacterium magnum]